MASSMVDQVENANNLRVLVSSACLSFLAYLITAHLTRALGPSFAAKGLKGKDMLKQGAELPDVPESSGVIAAATYILLLCLFAPLPYYAHFVSHRPLSGEMALGSSSSAFPHDSLTTYLASLLSLLIATFLGFLDDVFDIRWRYKLPIPIIASIPLLLVYFAGDGLTDVVLPKTLGIRHIFGVEDTQGLLNLGVFYYLYMAMLSTFCTNSINILAGINGVEVGQALVIAISVAVNDLFYIDIKLPGQKSTFGLGLAKGSKSLVERHLFSFYLMLPLIGVCLGLLRHNWFPARTFVGDTFCYFAGMAFAVVGILGHFSKTLLLFFFPQIFNFVLSTPQLFGLVPCPRHRLPSLNKTTGLLEPSYAVFITPPSLITRILLQLLALLRIVRLKRNKDKTEIIACSNLTIINAVLVAAGSMREDTLTASIMTIQVAGSVVAFAVRYGLAAVFYSPSSGRA